MSYQNSRCEEPFCRHHKTKHRYGYGKCRVNGCMCGNFEWYTPEERERQQLERAKVEARYREENAERLKAADEKLARKPFDLFRYDSFTELMHATDHEPFNDKNKARWRAIKNGENQKNRSGWAMEEDMTKWCEEHGYGLEQVGGFMLHGWDAGVERLNNAFRDLRMPALTDVRRRGVWYEMGDTLSIDRLYAGNQRCWYTSRRAQKNTPPRLQILVQATMAWMVNAENAFWRGAVATALAQAAVAVGYTVAVDTVQSVTDYANSGGGYDETGSGYLQVTRVKDYDAPLNVATLCALTAHPACLRVITFAHGYANSGLNINGHWGHVYEPTESFLRRRGFIDSPRALPIIVPQNLLSKEAANTWLNKTVAHLEKLAEEGWRD